MGSVLHRLDQRPQVTATEFLLNSPLQVRRAPAHNPLSLGPETGFDRLDQGLAMGRVRFWLAARHFGLDQGLGTAGVEVQNPQLVPNPSRSWTRVESGALSAVILEMNIESFRLKQSKTKT